MASRWRASVREPAVPLICLETALPAKFGATIREALGREPGAARRVRRASNRAAALRGAAGRCVEGQGVHRGPRRGRLTRRRRSLMAYALRNLVAQSRGGVAPRVLPAVDRLAFRFDLAQVVLLFVLSAIIDIVGDFLRAAPPREFAIEGAGAELYSGAVLLLVAAV